MQSPNATCSCVTNCSGHHPHGTGQNMKNAKCEMRIANSSRLLSFFFNPRDCCDRTISLKMWIFVEWSLGCAPSRTGCVFKSKQKFFCNADFHIEHICWHNFSNCTYCLWQFLCSVNIVTAGFSAGEWGSQIGKIRDRVKVWRDQLDPIADASPGKLYKQAAKEHHLNDEDKIKCLPIYVYVSKTPVTEFVC